MTSLPVAAEISNQHADTRELLARLWQRSLPVVEKRLSVLSAVATATTDAALGGDLRSEAISEAHKLAGSLGMFGYAKGTELAREIEVLLEEVPVIPAARLRDLIAALRSEIVPVS